MDITYVGLGGLTYKSAPDGSLYVYGKATGPDLDLDQQICDPEWLKTAMPQWMATGANIREMHQSIAAGIGLELAADGEDWMLKSEVVDENTKRKVEKKVLGGYSIGIKNARVVKDAAAPNGRIVAGQIVEVSLVDRPANPTATVAIAKAYGGELEIAKGIDLQPLIPEVEQSHDEIAQMNQEVSVTKPEASRDADEAYPAAIVCPACNGLGTRADDNETCAECGGNGMRADKPVAPDAQNTHVDSNLGSKAVDADLEKKDYSDKERQALADKGQALPDGSYPIKTVGDLKNAIQSFGRAKDKATTKAHIKARAEALGREDLIPDNWKAAGADLEKMEHDADDLAAVRQSLINLITAELNEMATGAENEVCDVAQLLQALDLFVCWWQNEANENETTDPFTTTQGGDNVAYIGLGVSAELIKSASAEDATAEQRAELRDEIVKALGLGEVITAKAALDEAKEEIALLKAALDDVREMATPGGPALRATHAQAAKAADAERLQSEAARYRRLSEEVTEPTMKAGYLQKALMAEADARAITRN